MTGKGSRHLPPQGSGIPAMTTAGAHRTLVVHLYGDVDLAGAELLGRAMDALDVHERKVVVDLSEVRFTDAAGLTLLADPHDRCRTAPTLRGVGHRQQRLLAQTGLDRAFTVRAEPVLAQDRKDLGPG